MRTGSSTRMAVSVKHDGQRCKQQDADSRLGARCYRRPCPQDPFWRGQKSCARAMRAGIPMLNNPYNPLGARKTDDQQTGDRPRQVTRGGVEDGHAERYAEQLCAGAPTASAKPACFRQQRRHPQRSRLPLPACSPATDGGTNVCDQRVEPDRAERALRTVDLRCLRSLRSARSRTGRGAALGAAPQQHPDDLDVAFDAWETGLRPYITRQQRSARREHQRFVPSGLLTEVLCAESFTAG